MKRAVIDLAGLGALLAEIVRKGYELIGPRVRDGVIAYDEISGVGDLPRGWGDEQEAGRYRVVKRGNGAFFAFATCPDSPKKFVLERSHTLWTARRSHDGQLEIDATSPLPPRRAIIGVRACEIAALQKFDRIFRRGSAVDRHYGERRQRLLLVAVQCGFPAATCFCASMGSGPDVRDGYDILLTEILEDGAHRFVVNVATPAGLEVLAPVPTRSVEEADDLAASGVLDRARKAMGRSLQTAGLRDLLCSSVESDHWDDVARRCLSCANCTMVCPTCYCTSISDTSRLSGNVATRVRSWDSCFTLEFSALHGGTVRSSTRSRYRHWLAHKLASWHDQFGGSGCVGCGRCITWCPVGIDLTAVVGELQSLHGVQPASGEAPSSRTAARSTLPQNSDRTEQGRASCPFSHKRTEEAVAHETRPHS